MDFNLFISHNKYYELNNDSLDNTNNIYVISNINDKDSLLIIKKDLDYYRNEEENNQELNALELTIPE